MTSSIIIHLFTLLHTCLTKDSLALRLWFQSVKTNINFLKVIDTTKSTSLKAHLFFLEPHQKTKKKKKNEIKNGKIKAMRPKLKDINKIADTIAIQAVTSQLPNLRERSSDSFKSLSVRWGIASSCTRKRKFRRGHSNRVTRGPLKRSHHSEFKFEKERLKKIALFISSFVVINTFKKKTNKQRCRVQDFYTDIDAFTYNEDLTSFRPTVDVNQLINRQSDSIDTRREDQLRSINYEHLDELNITALIEQSESLLSSSTSCTNDYNFGESLFDDPDLLNTLPQSTCCNIPQTPIANSNVTSLTGQKEDLPINSQEPTFWCVLTPQQGTVNSTLHELHVDESRSGTEILLVPSNCDNTNDTQATQLNLEIVTKISSFQGLESTIMLKKTVDVKEQERIAQMRTAQIDGNILASKLVSGGSAYEEVVKQKSISRKIKKTISVNSSQVLQAKSVFKQLEKENCRQNANISKIINPRSKTANCTIWMYKCPIIVNLKEIYAANKERQQREKIFYNKDIDYWCGFSAEREKQITRFNQVKEERQVVKVGSVLLE
ncbi:hypothetical protein RFI_20364 [Reticulomyxa filosa]|uniref:Uncharacterized protein n=1 Tax=Reticulomyxa filosa TaxID=46433 RepID=X6MU64_RETFI|nr:hypothetical protein RFI_20364 [Reticulomyxa filosa]|eukprot:ETO16972.1 hypothetical protein RFI_20364 [Reticulomyxa filosa]